MNNSVNLTPIGHVSASQQYRYQQPRQGEFAQNSGKIILNGGENFEQALTDLEGFDRIWVIFLFHQNSGWRPKVNPPMSYDGKKKGVFATRSPHRPNPIGMSCIELVAVKGRELTIKNFDLLDGTPILDIKPYISHYDSYPEASTGWLPATAPRENDIEFLDFADQQSNWLIENCGPDLFDLVNVQLSLDPLNGKRKRVTPLDNDQYELAFRTWRIRFTFDESQFRVTIISITSGYSSDDLCEGEEDKYEDKELHRSFIDQF